MALLTYELFIQTYPGLNFITIDPARQDLINAILIESEAANPECAWTNPDVRLRAIGYYAAHLLQSSQPQGGVAGAAIGSVSSISVGAGSQSVSFGSAKNLDEWLSSTVYGILYQNLKNTRIATGFVI